MLLPVFFVVPQLPLLKPRQPNLIDSTLIVLLHYSHVHEAAGLKNHRDFLPKDYLEALPNNHPLQDHHMTEQDKKILDVQKKQICKLIRKGFISSKQMFLYFSEKHRNAFLQIVFD